MFGSWGWVCVYAHEVFECLCLQVCVWRFLMLFICCDFSVLPQQPRVICNSLYPHWNIWLCWKIWYQQPTIFASCIQKDNSWAELSHTQILSQIAFGDIREAWFHFLAPHPYSTPNHFFLVPRHPWTNLSQNHWPNKQLFLPIGQTQKTVFRQKFVPRW